MANFVFIKEDDLSTLIRDEIRNTLDNSEDLVKFKKAEIIAIDQIRNYLTGRYDLNKVFNVEQRDTWIVTITIDIALYHLYSKQNKREIPEQRSLRYQDALDFLVKAGKGTLRTNLPVLEDYTPDLRIKSRYTAEDQRF